MDSDSYSFVETIISPDLSLRLVEVNNNVSLLIYDIKLLIRVAFFIFIPNGKTQELFFQNRINNKLEAGLAHTKKLLFVSLGNSRCGQDQN